MKICLVCNVQYDDMKLYCKNCGKLLSIYAEQLRADVTPAVGYCPECGKEIPSAGAKFCKHCGARLPAVGTTAAEPALPGEPPLMSALEPETLAASKPASELRLFESTGYRKPRLSDSSKMAIWISSAFGVLLVVGIGIWMYRNSQPTTVSGGQVQEISEAPSKPELPKIEESAHEPVDAEAGKSLPSEEVNSAKKPSSSATYSAETETKGQGLIPVEEPIEQASSEEAGERPGQGLVPVREGQGLVPATGAVSSAPTDDRRSDVRGQTWEIKNELFEVAPMVALSASGNNKGDRFLVKVLRPERFRDAIIGGQVTKAKASGKVKGKSELLFAFDNQLVLTDGTVIPIDTALVGVKNSQGVAGVDEEGHVIGRSSKRQDLVRTGILSGIGALVGGLTAGKEGAAKGAAIGAVVGLAVTFTTRGEDIRLAPGSIFELSVTSLDEPQQ